MGGLWCTYATFMAYIQNIPFPGGAVLYVVILQRVAERQVEKMFSYFKGQGKGWALGLGLRTPTNY